MPGTTTTVAATAPDRIRIEERSLRDPGAGEVLLEVRICGLCGTDLFKLQHHTVPPGTVLGHELVGTVAALGSAVEDVKQGQRVVVTHHVGCGACHDCTSGAEPLCDAFGENLLEPGGFSSRLVVRPRGVAHTLFSIPDEVSDEAAVFLEPASCVLRGIRRAGLPSRPGAGPPVVVILGGGAMGLLHLLCLKAVEPSVRVIVAEPVAGRRDLALRLGAAGAAPPGDETLKEVSRESDGSGADVVFDTVGGAARLADALSMLRGGGAVVLFAHAAPGEVAGFPLNDLFKREQRIIATYSGGVEDRQLASDLIIAGRLDASALVTHRFPLSRFEDGVDLVRGQAALKVLFDPWSEP